MGVEVTDAWVTQSQIATPIFTSKRIDSDISVPTAREGYPRKIQYDKIQTANDLSCSYYHNVAIVNA